MTEPELIIAIKKCDESLALLRDNVSKVEIDREDLLLKLAEIRWGVKPGVIVSTSKGEVLVAEVETAWLSLDSGRPWLRGYYKKKDGSWSTALHRVYREWELVGKLEGV